MYRGATERGFVSVHHQQRRTDNRVVDDNTQDAIAENRGVNSFTYAELFGDCFRYLGINDPAKIRKLTLAEYKALRKGAILKSIDDMERMADHAYKTALAGGFGKDGKPIIKKPSDLFDRTKVERALLSGFENTKKVDPELVKRFARSKARAEAILNGDTFEEDN